MAKHTVCVEPGCSKLARKRVSDEVAKLCISHGGGRPCAYPDCHSVARDKRGLCFRHRNSEATLPVTSTGVRPHTARRENLYSLSALEYHIEQLSCLVTVAIAHSDPISKVEKQFSRILEAYIEDISRHTEIPSNSVCHVSLNASPIPEVPELRRLTSSSIIRDWKNLKRCLREWNVSGKSIEDIESLVRLGRSLCTGDLSLFAYELMHTVAIRYPTSAWPSSRLCDELLNMLKPAVFGTTDERINPTLLSPPKWEHFANLIRDIGNSLTREARANEVTEIKLAVITRHKTSSRRVRKLIRLGTKASVAESFRRFVLSLDGHAYFRNNVNPGAIGLTYRDISLLRKCACDPNIDGLNWHPLDGIQVMDGRKYKLALEPFEITSECIADAILSFNPDRVIFFDNLLTMGPVPRHLMARVGRIIEYIHHGRCRNEGAIIMLEVEGSIEASMRS